jgi:hypothetical protein
MSLTTLRDRKRRKKMSEEAVETASMHDTTPQPAGDEGEAVRSCVNYLVLCRVCAATNRPFLN